MLDKRGLIINDVIGWLHRVIMLPATEVHIQPTQPEVVDTQQVCDLSTQIGLPEVCGETLPCSLSTYIHRCRVALANEQAKLNPDNVVVELLCDAVRLAREYDHYMRPSD